MATPREFSEAQQRYLLWAFNDARHQLSPVLPTRTRQIFQDKGLIIEDWALTWEERERSQDELRDTVRAARDVLNSTPDFWGTALEHLQYAVKLQARIAGRRYRLTDAGLDVVRKLQPAP